MATPQPSNDSILDQLRNGTAEFVLLSSPASSITASNSFTLPSPLFHAASTTGFFARIDPTFGGSTHKRYSVHKVAGDGRCMFRALVKGMALNKGVRLSSRQETENADELRMAVKEVLCNDEKERSKYQEAIIAITVEESLKRYCQRIGRSDFWGGESELLCQAVKYLFASTNSRLFFVLFKVLSKLCQQPITVYIPEHEHRSSVSRSGFIPIAEYGSEFCGGKGNPDRVVKLLYSGSNHYDLLV